MTNITINVVDDVDIMALTFDDGDKTSTVANAVNTRKGTPADKIYLYLDGAMLAPDKTLSDNGVKKGNTVDIGVEKSNILGSTIMCFSPHWDFVNMVDIKYTLLYSQIAADKAADRFSDAAKWFTNYYVALGQCGWTMGSTSTNLTYYEDSSSDTSSDTSSTSSWSDTIDMGASVTLATLNPVLHDDYEKTFLANTLDALQLTSNMGINQYFQGAALLDSNRASFQVVVGGIDYKHLDIAFIQYKDTSNTINDVLFQDISSSSFIGQIATNVMYFKDTSFDYMRSTVFQTVDEYLTKHGPYGTVITDL